MRHRFRLCFLLLLPAIGGLSFLARPGSGDDGPEKSSDRRSARSGSRNGAPENPMAVTPAREAAALTFAKLHHEELAKLLAHLKKRDQKAYARAIRRLYLDSERLARIKERGNAKRHELALRIWKLDSRIRLMAARVLLAKQSDPKLEAQLKEALRERVDLRIQQMEIEHRRALKRAQRLAAGIAELQANRDDAVEKELQRVKRSLGLRKGRGKSRPKSRTKNRRSNPKTNPKSKRSKHRNQESGARN